MDKKFKKLLKELKDNHNVVVIQTVDSASGSVRGTITQVREDFINLLDTSSVNHMIPIAQIENIDY